MKIAEVSPYSLSVPGGVQGQVVGLAHAMRDLGHEVDIFSPYDEATAAEELISLGRSLKWSANGSVAPIAVAPSMWKVVREQLKNSHYDVIHLHEPLAPFVGVAALLYKTSPIAGTFHRSGVSTIYRSYGMLFRNLSSRLDMRFAVSPEAMRTAVSVFGGDFEVMGNGVEVAKFKEAPPWPKEKPTVMFLGRHEHRKGLEVLLQAVEEMSGDFEVWIVGDGPETLELRKRFRTNPRLQWLGRVSEAEKSSRLRSADVLCAPSLYGESFGMVLLEGMAAGCVVVATDIRGYASVARNSVEALLCEPGDTKALKELLVKALWDEDLAQEVRSKGEERVHQFSMDRLAKSYLERFGAYH